MQKLKARRDAGKEVPDPEFLRAYGDLTSALDNVDHMSRKRYFMQLVNTAKSLHDVLLPEVSPAHTRYACCH